MSHRPATLPWLYSYTALYTTQLYSAIQYTCYTSSALTWYGAQVPSSQSASR